jgi:arginase family enzyme
LRRPLRIFVVDAHADCQEPEDEHDPALSAASWLRCAIEDEIVSVAYLWGHRQLALMDGVVLWDQSMPIPAVDHFSIDLDGIDPSHAPGVDWPEFGGLHPQDVVGMINTMKAEGVYSYDVVEYNYLLDAGVVTARLGARLAERILFRK